MKKKKKNFLFLLTKSYPLFFFNFSFIRHVYRARSISREEFPFLLFFVFFFLRRKKKLRNKNKRKEKPVLALSRLKGQEATVHTKVERKGKMINKVVQDQQHKSGCHEDFAFFPGSLFSSFFWTRVNWCSSPPLFDLSKSSNIEEETVETSQDSW